MKRFEIVLKPQDAALSVGGQSSPRFGGHKATARDAAGRLVIPATALRGALRVELERLLRGLDPPTPVCSANKDDAAIDDKPCECPVCRLFGRGGTATGTLRLEDALFHGGDVDAEDVVMRPQVAVSRTTGTAAEDHLLFQETSPVFPRDDLQAPTFRARAVWVRRGSADGKKEREEDLRNLRAACRALRAVGSGKARGLGWVECSLEETEDASEATPSGAALSEDPGTSLELVFKARAPLHIGAGPPLGGYHFTRRYAPASTVRGAVAFALLEQGLAEPEDEAFQELAQATAFGSARPAGLDPCLTRRRCRPERHVFDELVAQVVRRRAAEHGVALAVVGPPCPQEGCKADKAEPTDWAQKGSEPFVRVRTRTALNRRTGTSMDAKLYAQEVLENRPETPLRLVAQVELLSPAARTLLAKLHGREVWLGAKRSKGQGRCRLQVRPATSPNTDSARETVASLTRALQEGWSAVRRAVPGFEGELLPAGHSALALVLTEPWKPANGGGAAAGPLGPEVAAAGGTVLASFHRTEEVGGFEIVEAGRWGRKRSGERRATPHVAVGAVYVYQLPETALDEHLDAWLRQGTEGSAPFGHGRFRLRGPETDS